MKIRISQLKQRLDDYRLPLEEVAARALRAKREDVLSARLARRSVDARDKGDVHFILTLDVETARPLRLPRNAEEIREERGKTGLGSEPTARGSGVVSAAAAGTPSAE